MGLFSTIGLCHDGNFFWVSRLRMLKVPPLLTCRCSRLVVGPPVGGALYSRFGFRAPFILGEICTLVDLLGRFLIIERQEALTCAVVPAALGANGLHTDSVPHDNDIIHDNTETTPLLHSSPTDTTHEYSNETHSSFSHVAIASQPSSLLVVMIKLAKSPRALVALTIAFTYGWVVPYLAYDRHDEMLSPRLIYTSLEPALPVHMRNLYGFDPWKIGLVFLSAVIPTIICESCFCLIIFG
jgi:MFS family permease